MLSRLYLADGITVLICADVSSKPVF